MPPFYKLAAPHGKWSHSLPLTKFPVLPKTSSTSIRDPRVCANPLPSLSYKKAMPGLNPFPFVLSSSCTTLYLPLNPALGLEFSHEFSFVAFFLTISLSFAKSL
jgi:hypothetical protein